MKKTKQNRGLRNSGRVVLAFFMVVFFAFFVAVAISFGVIAGTGVAREQNLFDLALETYLFDGRVTARRGTIRDRNGRDIAAQHPSYTMFANFHPDWGTVVTDVEGTASALASVLGADVETFRTNLAREDVFQVEFGVAGQRLTFSQKNDVLELELPGIYFRDTLTRSYPNGLFASHTIGYTIFGETDELIGIMGLEGYFNDLLTGQNGYYQFLGDRFGMLQPGQERMHIHEARHGYDLQITIDETIQLFLETAFDEVLEEAERPIDNMVGVVMDVRTGEILAAGSRPTFDPNTREPVDYINALLYPIEPGSTIKVVTYAAAINEGHYQGDRTFESGTRTLPGNTSVRDWQMSWGALTFDQGFLRSSNTAVIDLFRYWLPFERWLDYLEAFGFGAPVGLPLPDEFSGRIPAPTNSPVDLYMSGFGQGEITVTPVQQLQALSAILNDGQMIRPQLILEIYDPNRGVVIEAFEPEIVGQPITPETARQVQDLMIEVVANPDGTAYHLYALDVPSGGKTGTAQLFDTETGSYHTHVHIYSYIGFAPAENPEIMMFIAVQQERETLQPLRTGHAYASQVYQSVMNNALRYLGLGAPTAPTDTTTFVLERTSVPSVMNLPVEDAQNAVEAAGLTPIVIGGLDRVFGQSPAAAVSVNVGDKVFIRTDTEDQLPDFRGWNRAEITTYGELLGLDVQFIGQGLAVRQSLRAGRTVGEGTRIVITLE